MPNVLWIWDIINMCQVALVHQLSPIKSVLWNPLKPDLLAYSCGNNFIYLWGGPSKGCDVIEVPAVNFMISQFKWSPDGRSLALVDKDKFCLAFMVEE
jgi:WD40 repeat protein